MTSVGLEHDRRVRDERRRLGVRRRAEAEQRRRLAEPLGEVRQRRDPDPAADEQRALDVEVEAVAERARGRRSRRRVASAQSASCPGRSGSTRNASSPGGARQSESGAAAAARRLEHEELAGDARLEPAALEPQQRVRPDRAFRDAERAGGRSPASAALTPRQTEPIRSCSDSARLSARAFAIACTAAAAPEMVVMHGTRATSAASRIR